MKHKNIWLIAATGVLATAITILFIRKDKGYRHERPPKGAPQLDITNPGSQDDFPKPPIESELG
ncbi:MAG TPA: hypothetical protein VM935_03280 [Chitinophagaceae bacterium]|nr:hypothetical protein [Chitinophagaceae bacterium]